MPRKQKITAITVLRQMDSEYRMIKFPNARYYYHDKSIKDSGANEIMKCIELFHKIAGGVAERVHTQGRMVNNVKKSVTSTGFNQTVGSMTYIPTTGRKGSADMSIVYKGINVKCEIKYGKDRQSEAQKKYQQDIENAGGIYIIVKSFEDYLVWFSKQYGRTELMQRAIDSLNNN